MKLSDDKTKDTLLKAGAVVVLYYTLSRADAKNKKDQADADLSSKPEAAQAATIKTLLRPYGYMWMRYFTIGGIDVDGVMAVAGQITDLNAVVKEYQNFVGKNEPSMHDDLQLCLGAESYQKFLSLATKGKTGSWYYTKESTNVPANYWVFTIAESNIRRTPIKEAKLIGNNIVKTVAKGKILGATTGKFGYDEKNRVLFIEFWTLLKKENKRVTYFVAKSQVELLSNADKLARDKKQGVSQVELIEGVGGIDQPHEVITTTNEAIIYDEKFNKVGIAAKNTIVGFPLMTLDTGKGKHIQLKTLQGLLRWVRADQAQIRDRRF